ncbi:MAG TPA: bifunctional diaminohydroxyphosphoribosylaminopyrimidine deaminase/5-amino-6-(5-phosphoribosylamino)uracil reductase RibD [candidate division Zixibacteria bacterium]|nr:bifunctional diaminohydroxyphosphoribosylaminopyrimidine deaminase/5-amino-6-(5-phosphoribosylamino)uracil reductase RibD [candidate division Zixibacteria bacterium]
MTAGRDEFYMERACRLAEKGAGRTSPNPMVGAVLVKGNRVVGAGYHARAGDDHAEIVALKRAGRRARGATLYINLEPCNHYGRTPPCTRALIEAGIKEVVAGMRDPNPLVAGKGFAALRRAGVIVRSGVLEERCRELNEAFVKFITRRRPFVILKLAATLDGRIATVSGDARWITGARARERVHELRNRVDAVLVGAGTVAADDPRLTCRIKGGRDPWRVILDRDLTIPLSARLLRQRHPEKTIVLAGPRPAEAKKRALEATGARVWCCPLSGGRIRWSAALRRLADRGIVSLLIEGGAATAASALAAGVVDKVLFFYAPKLFGGDGRPMLESLGVRRVAQAVALERLAIRRFGPDFLVSGYISKK